jgi:predicted N-formylglutamate amidohydrolase
VTREYFFLSCEHGGNQIPSAYRNVFASASKVLTSHRGLDIGALGVAKLLSKTLKAPLLASTTSRLLVDLNRSVGHPNLFSQFTKGFSNSQKDQILKNYYYPYRLKIEKTFAIQKQVLHVSIHSFTPKLNGELRNADLGLLYDPRSPREVEVAKHLKAYLKISGLKVRMNYPYRGTSDGLTTNLRKRYKNYSGLEIELNQKLFEKQMKQNQILFAGLLSKGLQTLRRTQI